MCGICGFNWEDKKLLDQMLSEMSHRGPDSKGKFFDKGVSLGNARLSIIDLSKKGNQPIFNKDKLMLIVYNGELYNYRALRTELISKGYNFNSGTDTEVILHAYEEYGIDCLSKFRGIFAFCIYDTIHKKLFLARDHLGVKPLYYYNTNEEFIFASEIKSILKYWGIEPSLNLEALPAYLSFRYVPGPNTMFNGIMKLLPGHYLVYNLKKQSVLVGKYWDIRSTQKVKYDNDLLTQLRLQLKDSVNAQMAGDVPGGIFLSGGLDSSSVLAFMKQANPTSRISTFSLGFESQEGYENELRYARLVSEYFETYHNEIIISQDSLKILPKLIFHMDEPVSDATIVPTYFLSEKASRKVKFVLTGEGGDEIFGGYVHYGIINKLDTIRKSPFLKELILKTIKIMPSKVLTKMFNYPSIIGEEGKQRLIESVQELNDDAKMYTNLISVFNEHDKEKLIDKSLYYRFFHEFISDLRKEYFNSKESIITQIRLREMQTWLPDYILTRLDKMSMSCSLESRVPLLDINLVGMVCSFPLKHRQNKNLLKIAMKNYLPGEIIKRKKYPFTLPIDSWYNKGFRDMAESVLDDNKEVYRFINKTYVDKLLKQGKSNILHSRQLWSILTLSIWHKIFIEKMSLKHIN